MLETEPLGRFKLILFLFFSVAVSAQSFPEKKVDELLKTGSQFILNQDYASADSIFKILEMEFKNLPVGNIYYAANSIAKSLDYGTEFEHDFIISNLEHAVKLSEILLDENENNLWNNYYMALSKGYLAYYLALEEEYIDAFSEGYFSISFFNRCSEINPEFYESKIAAGSLLYWKSEKANWIPFVKDDKQTGINILEEVIKHKTYNYYIAVNSLLWIYINEKDFNKAIEIANLVLNEYPGNRYFQWGLARAFEEIDKHKAIKIYSGILKSLNSINRLNFFNEITLKHKIAMLYERIGNYKSAMFYCSEILSIQFINENELNRINERLVRVKEQKERLAKLLNGE